MELCRAEPRRNWAAPLVVAAVLIVFAPIVSHPFLCWDDDYTIEQNPLIAHPSLENIAHYWRHAYMDLYVPVTYTAWSTLARISATIYGPDAPLDPRLFHAASVALHILNAFLVFGLLRRLLNHVWAAAAGAMLFALHPVQVETVAWASGMKDVLCASFSLIAIGQYLRSADSDLPRSWRRAHYLLGMLAMLLGMLSKPTAMVTPMLVGIIDLMVLRRPCKQVLKSVGPWFALAIPCIIWTKLCQPTTGFIGAAMWQRPLIAVDSFAFYLFKIVAPLHLAFDYGQSPAEVIAAGRIYWIWIAPLAVAALLWISRARIGFTPAAALMLFAAGIAPVSGLTPFDFQKISTVADHYLYLAMFGPALAGAWVLSRTKSRNWHLGAILILGTLAAKSAIQERTWRDDPTLFKHALAVNPRSWTSYFKLGYIGQREGEGLLEIATLKAKLRQDPLPDLRAAHGEFEQAARFYWESIRRNPNNVIADHDFGVTLMRLGRFSDAARAFAQVLDRRRALIPSERVKYDGDAALLTQCQSIARTE